MVKRKMKFKTAEEFKIEMLENRYKNLKNQSFPKRFEAIAWDMNNMYSKAILDNEIDFTEQTIEDNFKKFLSIVYEEDHDNRFCGLELTDNNKNYPAFLLTVDADTHINNARDIQFALSVFLEEWYSELQYGDILTEWV